MPQACFTWMIAEQRLVESMRHEARATLAAVEKVKKCRISESGDKQGQGGSDTRSMRKIAQQQPKIHHSMDSYALAHPYSRME